MNIPSSIASAARVAFAAAADAPQIIKGNLPDGRPIMWSVNAQRPQRPDLEISPGPPLPGRNIRQGERSGLCVPERRR
jgi:hypothetical protein